MNNKRRRTISISSTDSDGSSRVRGHELATSFANNSGACSSRTTIQLPTSTGAMVPQSNRPPPSSHLDPEAIPTSPTTTPPLYTSCNQSRIMQSFSVTIDPGVNEVIIFKLAPSPVEESASDSLDDLEIEVDSFSPWGMPLYEGMEMDPIPGPSKRGQRSPLIMSSSSSDTTSADIDVEASD